MISLHSIKVSMKKKGREEEEEGGGESWLYRNRGWSVPECEFQGLHSRQPMDVIGRLVSMWGFHVSSEGSARLREGHLQIWSEVEG